MSLKQIKRKRETIFAAWMGECAYCGGKAETLDHLICKAHWGRQGDLLLSVHGYQNLVPACDPCNGAKGTKKWQRFCADPERRDRIERYVGLMTVSERRRAGECASEQAALVATIGGQTDFSLGARLKGVMPRESEPQRTDALAPSQ